MKAFSIRTELWLALIVILLSLLLLPALIYAVGAPLFGPYQSGLASMYAANLQGLLQLQIATWILALGPVFCVLLVRSVLRMTADPQQPKPIQREPKLNP